MNLTYICEDGGSRTDDDTRAGHVIEANVAQDLLAVTAHKIADVLRTAIDHFVRMSLLEHHDIVGHLDRVDDVAAGEGIGLKVHVTEVRDHDERVR